MCVTEFSSLNAVDCFHHDNQMKPLIGIHMTINNSDVITNVYLLEYMWILYTNSFLSVIYQHVTQKKP